MPTRHRDFRRRRKPQSDFWGTVKFVLWLGLFGILSFAVGALVIARVVLPGTPVKQGNQQDASSKPAPPASSEPQSPSVSPATRPRQDDDTIVEPVLPGSARTRSERPRDDDGGTSAAPRRERREREEPRTPEAPRQRNTDEGRRPERRATSDATNGSERSSSATRTERAPERQESEASRPRRRAEEARPTVRETKRTDAGARESAKPPSPPAKERSERRDNGIQHGESID